MPYLNGITKNHTIKYILYLTVALLIYLYLNLFKNILIDDTFITMRYVKTILNSGTWGFFPGHITNTATSPLNVILLTLISILKGATAQVPIYLAWIGLLMITATLIKISQLLFSTTFFGYLATLAFLFNPLLMSTLGLEGILFAALFILSIYAFLYQKWILLPISLGLLTITRAEGGLFFIVMLFFIPTTKLKLRLSTYYILAILPWYVFSWIHLGSFIPDTFFIKITQASWGRWSFFNGVILYCLNYPLETILSFVFLPLLLIFFNKHCRKSLILSVIALLGLVHFIGYSLLNVPPYHWYYVPEITAIILLGSLGLGIAYQGYQAGSWQKKALLGIIVFYSLAPALGMLQIFTKNNFSLQEMPIHTNWASHEKYREIGLWLKHRNKGETVALDGEIGTLAFYCDCYLLDSFSDRRSLKEHIIRNTNGSGIKPLLYKINFMFFNDQLDFPAYSFRLNGHQTRENAQNNAIMRWETATKWIPQGLINLYLY